MKNDAIFGMAFLFACATAAVADSPASKYDAYYPWTIGDAWVYTTTNKKKNDVFPMNVSITSAWNEDGLSGIILVQKDKRGQMRQFMLRNDQGIFLKKLGLSKSYTPEIFSRINTPMPAVIYPLEPGTKVHWEGRLKAATVNQSIVFDGEVVGWEDVTVPAGQFHCIKLHFHELRDNKPVDEDAWYAENVGQVKYDGGQYVKELKSFKVAESTATANP